MTGPAEQPGIYLIVNTRNGKVYVGSAANVSKRWSRHRLSLTRGTHPNVHLQASWDRYGPDAFMWQVVARPHVPDLIPFEQRWIDDLRACDPTRGYNKATIAGVSYGGTGHAWTPEQRAYSSVVQRALKPPHPVGTRCPKGHVKDGTYRKRRANGSVKIRCQTCERDGARERARSNRGG